MTTTSLEHSKGKNYCRRKQKFTEECNSSCSCLEVILDREEAEEQSASKITSSKRSTLQKRNSIRSVATDNIDFMLVIDQSK